MHWRVQILLAFSVCASAWERNWKAKDQQQHTSVKLQWDGDPLAELSAAPRSSKKSIMRRQAKRTETSLQTHNPSHQSEHAGVRKLERGPEAKRSQVEAALSLLDMKQKHVSSKTTNACPDSFESTGCVGHGHQGNCPYVYAGDGHFGLCLKCIGDSPITYATFTTLGVHARWCGSAPYFVQGSGWCKPQQCSGSTDSACHTNGYFKDSTNFDDCYDQCDLDLNCIGLAISDATHSTTPNRCYIYIREGPIPSGWTGYPRKYYSIGATSVEPGDSVACARKMVVEVGKCQQNGDTGGYCTKASQDGRYLQGLTSCVLASMNMTDVTAIEHYEMGLPTALYFTNGQTTATDSQYYRWGDEKYQEDSHLSGNVDHCMLFHNAAFAPTQCPSGYTSHPGTGGGSGSTITKYSGDYTFDTTCLVLPQKGQFDLIGNGWCRPEDCPTLSDQCRVNGAYKDNSNFEQCDALCTAMEVCIGFAYSDTGHPQAPNRCYLHFSRLPDSDAMITSGGWIPNYTTLVDIHSSTGGLNAQCYRKAPLICGNTCSQVIRSGSVKCDVTTWGTLCGDETPPKPATSATTLSQLCPRECGTLDTGGTMDICGKTCNEILADVSSDEQPTFCDDTRWSTGCPDDAQPPYGYSRHSTISELCPKSCGKAIWETDPCQMGEWEPWNPCPVTCGIGDQNRARSITYTATDWDCGSTQETRACNAGTDCPVTNPFTASGASGESGESGANAQASTASNKTFEAGTEGVSKSNGGSLGAEINDDKSGGDVEEGPEGVMWTNPSINYWLLLIPAVLGAAAAGVLWYRQNKKGKEGEEDGEQGYEQGYQQGQMMGPGGQGGRLW